MNPVSAFTPLWVNYKLMIWTLREIELWFSSSSDGCHHTWLIQRLGDRYPISLCPQSPIFPRPALFGNFILCTVSKRALLLCMILQFQLHCSCPGSGPCHSYRLLGVSLLQSWTLIILSHCSGVPFLEKDLTTDYCNLTAHYSSHCLLLPELLLCCTLNMTVFLSEGLCICGFLYLELYSPRYPIIHSLTLFRTMP